MKTELFIDTLRTTINNLELFSLKLLTKNTSLPLKIQQLSLSLLTFKSTILTTICSFIREGPPTQILAKLQQQQLQAKEKLKKLSLHALLRKKISKMQRESMMHSISEEAFDSSFVEDPNIAKLRNSMVLIEKDLGISEEFDQHEEQPSQIVHRSMASLEMTPIKNSLINATEVSDASIRIQDEYILPENQDKNTSPIAQDSTLKQSNAEKKVNSQKMQNRKKKTVFSNSKGGMLDNLLEQSLQSYIGGPVQNQKNLN